MRLPLFAHLSEYVCGHVVFSWTHKAENIQCIRYAHRRGFRRWVLYAFTTFSTHFRFACDCRAGAWMLTVMTCHSWCRRCLYASAWPTFFSHFCPFTKFCTSIMCDAMRLAGNERALGSAVRGMVCAFDTSSAPCFCCGLSLSRAWAKSGRTHGLAIIP